MHDFSSPSSWRRFELPSEQWFCITPRIGYWQGSATRTIILYWQTHQTRRATLSASMEATRRKPFNVRMIIHPLWLGVLALGGENVCLRIRGNIWSEALISVHLEWRPYTDRWFYYHSNYEPFLPSKTRVQVSYITYGGLRNKPIFDEEHMYGAPYIFESIGCDAELM
jgi:hypothetical protein